MKGLGDIFDIGTAWAPVDLDAANGVTGKRISMAAGRRCTFLMICGTGPATFSLDFQQHTAYTGGTSADLDSTAVSDSIGITEYYYKAETALDNDESWVRVAQTEASEITLDAIGTQQKIVVASVNATQLGAGYTHLSVNAVSADATAHLSAGLYVVHGLYSRRPPANLLNLLRPGAANA